MKGISDNRRHDRRYKCRLLTLTPIYVPLQEQVAALQQKMIRMNARELQIESLDHKEKKQ